MSASALLIGASAASLNLCADEYLLLLARPQEIASVSFLAHDPLESPLWRSARRHQANRGSIEDVLVRRPKLLLTMGGGGRATRLLARRLRIRAVDLASPTSLGDVASNLRTVAAALGEPHRADPWLRRLARLEKTRPSSAKDSLWLSGGGQTIAAGSIGTSSHSGRVEMTIPPGCCERWRGSPAISPHSSANARQRGDVRRRSASGRSAISSATLRAFQPSESRARRSSSAAGSPSAFPTSRIAPRARYVAKLATSAECSRPYRSQTATMSFSRMSRGKSRSMSGTETSSRFRKRPRARSFTTGSTCERPVR